MQLRSACKRLASEIHDHQTESKSVRLFRSVCVALPCRWVVLPFPLSRVLRQLRTLAFAHAIMLDCHYGQTDRDCKQNVCLPTMTVKLQSRYVCGRWQGLIATTVMHANIVALITCSLPGHCILRRIVSLLWATGPTMTESLCRLFFFSLSVSSCLPFRILFFPRMYLSCFLSLAWSIGRSKRTADQFTYFLFCCFRLTFSPSSLIFVQYIRVCMCICVCALSAMVDWKVADCYKPMISDKLLCTTWAYVYQKK